ncbi:MAG: hypothetical protein ACM31C_23760 [Acidobacteriota bacterium]
MREAIVALALVVACRGGCSQPAPTAHHEAGRDGGPASLVPRLPRSDDPALALQELDAAVAIYRQRDQLGEAVAALLDRAAVKGQLEDFQDALALSAKYVEREPNQVAAWRSRFAALSRVHRFADARAALAEIAKRSLNRTHWEDLEAQLDEATGKSSLATRESLVKRWGSPTNVVSYAASLALEGRLDDALAVMPRAAAAVRDTRPALYEFILFQWGRLYELKGEMAAARELYAAAHARLPALEATTHLARAMMATGDRDGARQLVDAALAQDRHPELLELAGELDGNPAHVAEAKREWERYVAALPEAFSDHAARFYLAGGADPARALVLARANLANRDTREARALVVEAALAAKDSHAACEAVGPLLAPAALRSQQFVAWRALTACGRTDEAKRLAANLGIAH